MRSQHRRALKESLTEHEVKKSLARYEVKKSLAEHEVSGRGFSRADKLTSIVGALAPEGSLASFGELPC